MIANIAMFHAAPLETLKANAEMNSQIETSTFIQLGKLLVQNNWINPSTANTAPIIMMLVRAAPVIDMTAGVMINHAPTKIIRALANLD